MVRAEAMYKFYDTERTCRYNGDTKRSVNNYILPLCIKVVVVVVKQMLLVLVELLSQTFRSRLLSCDDNTASSRCRSEK